MKRNTVTTASVFFFGRTRFMGTGYFAVGKKDER